MPSSCRSLWGLLHHQAKLGHYNTQYILTFLDALHDAVLQDRPEQFKFVVVWANGCSGLGLVHQPSSIWRCILGFFFVALKPQADMPLLLAMEEACGDVKITSIRGWICHTKCFSCCLAGENIACDVDEILWSYCNTKFHTLSKCFPLYALIRRQTAREPYSPTHVQEQRFILNSFIAILHRTN